MARFHPVSLKRAFVAWFGGHKGVLYAPNAERNAWDTTMPFSRRPHPSTCYGIELEARDRDLNGLLMATGAAIHLANKGLAPSVARLFWQHDVMTAYVRLGAAMMPVEAAMASWSASNGEGWAAVVSTIGTSLGIAA